eukprot:TRINITY_DN5255_c0_g1_i1.p1 TRINITY_DN5255_c0_g1~~TRINITY_DN5255_c0_g1_i1.p1  ORF type:complete len:494 (+),score=152.16 TRINITY_DN5255_c0_g1_i1:677-2158(+)
MPPKKLTGQLGRSILNARTSLRPTADGSLSAVHTTDIDEKAEKAKKMQSATQMTDFEQFAYNAIMAERDFTAEKENAVVLQTTSFMAKLEPTIEEIEAQEQNWNNLVIPRRPKWNAETTAEELHQKERESFLEWRRKLAELEMNEKLVMTPFEKNIEVWRQLWRVVERSHVVVQIVDGRNPLLFRSLDLEAYVASSGTKKNILLVNKADLLTVEQRTAWADFFDESNVKNYAFWSANREQKKLNEQKAREHLESLGEALPEQEPVRDEQDEGDSRVTLLNRDDLLDYLASFTDLLGDAPATPSDISSVNYHTKLQVGMVGYPNVGKSSTINVLMASKKVAVAATPGKTKHFQTLELDDRMTLCDCPGLVFPTFLATRAHMIANGLLSIDNMTEFRQPVSLICRRIPRNILETGYGIILPPPKPEEDQNRDPTADELLASYAFQRGFMTVHGQPDESRAARIILKDYCNGKICYVCPPPTVKGEWNGVGRHGIR